MAIEAESVALSVYSIEPSKYFELKLAFICLSSPDINMVCWKCCYDVTLLYIVLQSWTKVLGHLDI